MKLPTLSSVSGAVLFCGIILLTTVSAVAQDCRLQIRCSGFTTQGYPTLAVSFAPTTSSCTGVRAMVQWSEDLKTWTTLPVFQFPCVTQSIEAQVIDPTDVKTRPCRFYRVLQGS